MEIDSMDIEEKKIIIDSMQDLFSLKEKYTDFEIDSHFSLLLSQLDLFKTISGLVVAIIGIGYILNNTVDQTFLSVSLFFSLATIFGTISYTREMIDKKALEINKDGEKFKEKIDDSIRVAIKAIKSNDGSIFFDYSKDEVERKAEISALIYAGEIFTFLFYNSIFFLLLSFFASKLYFGFFSIWTVSSILLCYFLSFKDWSIVTVNFLSELIRTVKSR